MTLELIRNCSERVSSLSHQKDTPSSDCKVSETDAEFALARRGWAAEVRRIAALCQ